MINIQIPPDSENRVVESDMSLTDISIKSKFYFEKPLRSINEITKVYRESFSKDEHKKLYGREWNIGEIYFKFLLELGISHHDRVLDIGCGAGRLGGHLIKYLNPGNYIGVDMHIYALQAFKFMAEELKLEDKLPLISYADLKLEKDRIYAFSNSCDYVIDAFVLSHMSEPELIDAFTTMYELLTPVCRLVSLSDSRKILEIGLGMGWSLDNAYTVTHQFQKDCKPDEWLVLSK